MCLLGHALNHVLIPFCNFLSFSQQINLFTNSLKLLTTFHLELSNSKQN